MVPDLHAGTPHHVSLRGFERTTPSCAHPHQGGRLSLDACTLPSACLRCLSLTYDDDMYMYMYMCMWFLIETLLLSCMTCVIETFGDADRCDGKKLYMYYKK